MSRVSRRSFVSGMAAMPFALWLQKEKTPIFRHIAWVRYEARTSQGQKMLQIYADAVNKMMNSTPQGDPRSWLFQWYTHAVRADKTKAGEINAIYGSGSSTNKSLATDMWNTCRAHFRSADETFFLPWHRMFVYYLEHMIRKISGKDEFSLPYWNYSVSGSAHGVLPPEFTKKSDPTFQWLYRDNRNPGVNGGQAIDKFDPGALDLTSLKQKTYDPQGVAAGFNMELDSGLHGNVHVDIGDTTNMGHIPWAARDPIFWMHHCNIDRLWASWNKNGGANPGGSWLTRTFTFADQNGTKIISKVQDFDALAKLNYTYDFFEPPPTKFIPLPWPPPQVVLTPIQIHGPGPVELREEAARLPLTQPSSRPQVEPFTLHVQRMAPEKRIFLVLRNLHADAHPGVLFHVFLDVPANTLPRQALEHRVGIINFFDAVRHGEQFAGEQQSTKFVSFDITELAHNLHDKKLLSEKPVVTIVPFGKPAADARPVIGEVSIVEQ